MASHMLKNCPDKKETGLFGDLWHCQIRRSAKLEAGNACGGVVVELE